MNILFLFEVMDKEMPLGFILLFFPIAGILGFFLARKNPIFLFLVYPLVFLFATLYLSELNDPFVGKAIIREAGYSYVVQSYIAIFIGIIFPFFGTLVWLKRRNYKKSRA